MMTAPKMITPHDADQNERLARVEESCHSLGRSIDRVRDDLHSHEERCERNWKSQHENTARIAGQLKIVLALLGGIGGTLLAVALELGFGIFFGGE